MGQYKQINRAKDLGRFVPQSASAAKNPYAWFFPSASVNSSR